MAEFILPELGEDVDEADVLKVLVAEGDTITLEQALLEIETEKATLDVPSSVVGVITKIHVSEGDTIKPGQLILTVSEVGAAAAAPASEAPAPEAAVPEAAPEAAATEPVAEAAPIEAESPVAEPVVAEEAEATPEVEATPAPVETSAVEPPPVVAEGQAIFASPAVRKFAREIGLDLAAVSGSGPGGRISEEDVKQQARQLMAGLGSSGGTSEATTASGAAASGGGSVLYEPRELPDFSQFGAVHREKLSRLRRTVARNMTQSWTEIPHVTLQRSADITEMEALRQRYKDDAKAAGGNLTISVFILKILAAALKAQPLLGVSLDMETHELIYKDYVHIGVAVDTERGLVVPAIRDVDEKNIIDLSVELNEMAERARTNKLTLDDSRGGMFTLTNLGSLSTGYFSPIINPPEVGVLGVGRAQWTPVLDENKEWEPRLMMPMSLSHDHRVVDGADGARFMQWIVDAIDNPMLLALEG
ncbi:MAG: 2-oxo acid dehydrogenase subunit E2 [Dehalococcoidia bacterium]|jgi:pyruvate dehydrogenase E2 component (dihydrolipoamide acetyltransferase)|nr:2-oxo acid dehydrogenase subunit E2 [Dehalococcoidia bacterium]